MRKSKKIVIGLTGKNASGKSSAAKYLKKKGFSLYSLSDILREEAAKKGLEPTRKILIDLGNNLRKRYGGGILANRIIKKLKDRSVVDSIRNRLEIKEFRKIQRFILLGFYTPANVRLRRIKKRSRKGDPVTMKELLAREREENKAEATNQQLNACLNMADKIIKNTGSLKDLYSRIDKVLSIIGLK